MKLTKLLALILTVNFVSGCPAAPVEVDQSARFNDVSKRPPDAKPGTIKALSQDEPFAQWVIYQDKLCDLHGCI